MNLAQLLSDRAVREGDRAAICTRRQQINFRQLDAASARFAGELKRVGLKPGDAALIICPMSIELYAALIACFRAGITAVFPDPSAGLEQLNDCVALTSPRAFLGTPKAHFLRFVSPAVRSIPRKIILKPWKSWATVSPAEIIESAAPSDAAMITFTSGSTGLPKAAPRTHGFLLAQHAVLDRTLGLTPGQVDLTALPVFVLANLASGVTSVVPDADLRKPGAIDPMPVIEQIRRWGITSAVASPAFFERIVAARTQLPTLHKVYTGGAPVFPSLLDRLAQQSPSAEITAVYGSTEAEPIAEIERKEIQPADMEAMRNGQGLLAGYPVAEIQCRIIRDQWGIPIRPCSLAEFETHAVSPGEMGEIVVSGDHVLRGYVCGRGDEETKIHVQESIWHRTGDLGRFDRDGRLWLLGRASARIQDETGVLYPFTLEAAVSMFTGVRRSAVVRVNTRRVLALDSDSIPEGLPEAIRWAGIEELRLCRIPVDRRHNAKVDYPALMKLLG
ncbi:MAG: AMP-binding protein [Acidobacteriaceae bacterium]|nr:AMP-binding protein [Acidobacteriaceae bacterium]